MKSRYPILYVDDEWTNRTVFEQNFNDEFTIVTVASGAEALKVLESRAIACIVTDQRMPEMSGNELLERAKQLYPQTIRVVLTAYGDLDPILKAVNDGLVARYVVKPWVKEELGKILAWAVEVYALGRESSDVQLRLLKSERLITLGSMAGSVLHEIRNLLSPAKNNSQYINGMSKHVPGLRALLQKHGSELSAEARAELLDFCDELPAASDDIIEVIRKIEDVLVSYRKVLKENTAGGGSADPKEAIRYALTLLRSGAIGIELGYDGPERLPAVSIGQTELTQILINLGGNAVQAYPQNARGRIRFVASAEGDLVRFAVSDDGPGMPPEILAKVGQPFFTTKDEGTGLGVSQCHRLVAKAGGKFDIESAPGKGTTVRFTLRRAP